MSCERLHRLVYRIVSGHDVADSFEESLASEIKGKLLNQSNPFMELLERDQIDMIFQELQETMTPEYESEGGVSSGKLKKSEIYSGW